MDRSKTSDKAGAWSITAIAMLLAVGGTYFLSSDILEGGAFAAKRVNRGGKAVGAGNVLESSGEGRNNNGNGVLVPRYKGGELVT